MAHSRTDQLMPYIIQNILTLLAPVLFAASIYMTLGRIIRAARGEEYSIIRVDLLTKTFVWGDVVSFLVQGGGSGMMAMGSSMALTGQRIVVGGLIIQICMFALFGVTAAVFHNRYEKLSFGPATSSTPRWKCTLRMVYTVSILIIVRSMFRIFEFVLGTDGYLMTHEWPLYVFDSVIMFAVVVLFCWFYPDQLQPHFKPNQLSSEETFDVRLNILHK